MQAFRAGVWLDNSLENWKYEKLTFCSGQRIQTTNQKVGVRENQMGLCENLCEKISPKCAKRWKMCQDSSR